MFFYIVYRIFNYFNRFQLVTTLIRIHSKNILSTTRKYPLRLYILGVLTLTTAYAHNCFGPTLGRWCNSEMSLDLIGSASFACYNTVVYIAQLCLASWVFVPAPENLFMPM